MADFSKAVDKVLDVEGGYQNMPEDIGNYNAYTAAGEKVSRSRRKGMTLRAGTNYGISAEFLSGRLGREVSVAEMKNLTLNQAVQLYKESFWDTILGDAIRNQHLAEMIFDGRVNHGRTGVVLLQRAINGLGGNLVVDGIFGPKTLEAVNTFPAEQVYECLRAHRAQLYHELAKRPGQHIFLNGWLNRLKKFPVLGPTPEGCRPGGSGPSSGAIVTILILGLITLYA